MDRGWTRLVLSHRAPSELNRAATFCFLFSDMVCILFSDGLANKSFFLKFAFNFCVTSRFEHIKIEDSKKCHKDICINFARILGPIYFEC